MLLNIRAAAVVSSFLLCLVSSAAFAAEQQPRAGEVACSVPEYAAAWRHDEQQGDVSVKLLVGADGSVRDTKLVESSGYATLDKASLRAGAKCKFTPAVKGSEKDQGWINVRYTWVIK